MNRGIPRWRNSHQIVKDTGEVALIAEAKFIGDLDQAKPMLGQELLGSSHAFARQILVRRKSRLSLE